jgi:hypothetical protein
MEDKGFRTWKDFTQHEYRRVNTFQLCVDDLAKDLYYDDTPDLSEKEDTEELNFDM